MAWENRSIRRKSYPIFSMSTTNPKWTGLNQIWTLAGYCNSCKSLINFGSRRELSNQWDRTQAQGISTAPWHVDDVIDDQRAARMVIISCVITFENFIERLMVVWYDATVEIIPSCKLCDMAHLNDIKLFYFPFVPFLLGMELKQYAF